jgi:hypothetical protein
VIGAIFAVPAVAIVAATLRYLRGTLVFERWGKPLVVPKPEESTELPTTASAATGLGNPRGSEERESGKGMGT